jgi:hypothetical protein
MLVLTKKAELSEHKPGRLLNYCRLEKAINFFGNQFQSARVVVFGGFRAQLKPTLAGFAKNFDKFRVIRLLSILRTGIRYYQRVSPPWRPDGLFRCSSS